MNEAKTIGDFEAISAFNHINTEQFEIPPLCSVLSREGLRHHVADEFIEIAWRAAEERWNEICNESYDFVYYVCDSSLCQFDDKDGCNHIRQIMEEFLNKNTWANWEVRVPLGKETEGIYNKGAKEDIERWNEVINKAFDFACYSL